MSFSFKTLGGAAAMVVCTTVGLVGHAVAEPIEGGVTIGVLADFSGPYSAWGGEGSVEAVEMAIEAFKEQNPDFDSEITVTSADFQLKPDIAVSIAKKWMSEGVDAILDLPHTASALAVNELLRGSDVTALMTGSASNDLTTTECSPNTVQWTYDQYSMATPQFARVASGGKWYFIAQDSVPGRIFSDLARATIEAAGGEVVGSSVTPIGTTDFSSALVQARASGAEAILYGQAGSDLVSLLKQGQEFGIAQSGIKVAIAFALLPDIKGIGPEATQGLIFTSPFYWDLNDGTRAFAKSFAERNSGKMPSAIQASAYSATLHYLKAVKATGTVKAADVVASMKFAPIDDVVYGKAAIRRDGRMMHDMLLVQVKSPDAVKEGWDLYDVIDTIPADTAFRPESTECSLVK